MPNVWPTSLGQLRTRGFKQRPAPNVLRSGSLSGRPKARRIASRVSEPVECTFDFNPTQLGAFKTFYHTTCSDGSDLFQGLNHPFTGADTVWLWDSDYEIAGRDGYIMSVSFRLVSLPDAPS